jgi:hypothetical protein
LAKKIAGVAHLLLKILPNSEKISIFALLFIKQPHTA